MRPSISTGPRKAVPSASAAPMPRPAPVTAAAAKAVAVKTDNMGRKSYERYSNNKINTRSIHSIIMLQLLVDFIQKNMINLRKEGDDMKLYSKEVHNFLVKDKII